MNLLRIFMKVASFKLHFINYPFKHICISCSMNRFENLPYHFIEIFDDKELL